MKLLLVDNVHLYKDPQGNYYAPSIYSHAFLQRYLAVFEEVRFLGKARPLREADKTKCLLVSGEGVEITELPWYQGMGQMILKMPELLPAYRKASEGCGCCIYRIAQVESFLAYLFRRRRIPYAVEMVNDPDSWSAMPGLVRKVSGRMSRKMIRHAIGASFVTEKLLQQRYAGGRKRKGYFEASYSSVELEQSDIAAEPIRWQSAETFRIVHVANAISNDMKGHKTLINVAKRLADAGCRFEVIFIGHGDLTEEYREYAASLGLEKSVRFIGMISGKKSLLDKLRECHMMVFPSKSEGLPRTLIEAMAVGLPCLSTPVGGIPELIDSRYLFDPEDSKGFADEILRLVQTPQELLEMSLRNLRKAREFNKADLGTKRTRFYGMLRKAAETNMK